MYWSWRRRRRQRIRKSPKQWVLDFLQRRPQQGAWASLVREVQENDLARFFNFHRMTPKNFHHLLQRIDPIIRRQDLSRGSLSPGLQLSSTLRYRASGDSMTSLHYLYRISKSSVTRIIPDTCEAIWDVLAGEVLNLPRLREWAEIAEDFEHRWDFPNCVGAAVDGKHIVVQCFNNTIPQFFNYKGTFSIVLMIVCDAHHRFTFVSIGAAGRESDGGIYENTILGRSILEGTLALPNSTCPPGSDFLVLHVSVGDNAFPLKETLLRPYSGAKRHASKVIFNYRLSRARRMIENTFGIFACKFRVFRKPIIANVKTVGSVVKASVALHNFLVTADLQVGPRQRTYIQPGLVDSEDRDGNIEPGLWRPDQTSMDGFRDMVAKFARNATDRVKYVQAKYRPTEYFMTYGQVSCLPEQERRYYSQ